MRRILLVLTLLILPVVRGGATDWPMFHLNPRHLAFNRAETTITRQNVKFLKQKWVGIAGDIVDYSSPAVVNGVVYVGSNKHQLLTFPAAGCGQSSCAPTWAGLLGGSILESSPVVSGG